MPKKIKYKNLPGGPQRSKDIKQWLGFIWRRLTSKPPIVDTTELVLPKATIKAKMQALQNQNSLTWLGHAAFLLKIHGKNILLDPFLSQYASPIQGLGPKRFTEAPLSPTELPPIDILIISHDHYDHLDKPTIQSLKNKDFIRVIVPIGLGDFFKKLGFTHVTELEWYHKWNLHGITIRSLPVYHFSKRTLFSTNTSQWCGYAISWDDKKLFFAGDTAYGSVFTEIGKEFGPFDYALLPIGAYQPEELMMGSHITPELAVKIGLELQAKNIIAMHWGTIMLTDEPPLEPPQRFSQAAYESGYLDKHCWILKLGETRALK